MGQIEEQRRRVRQRRLAVDVRLDPQRRGRAAQISPQDPPQPPARRDEPALQRLGGETRRAAAFVGRQPRLIRRADAIQAPPPQIDANLSVIG